MSQRGMAFPASRAERPVPVVENSGGGYDLKRYIRADTHKVPGYTGHVPGRKIEHSGIGRTYGTATRNLMNPATNPDATTFTMARNPTDFRQTQNKPIGQYTRPADDPALVYNSETSTLLNEGAEHVVYNVPGNETVPLYQGFLPGTRDCIGGPGPQYWRNNGKRTMDGAEINMNRTEYRDGTGNPRAMDEHWQFGSKTVTHRSTVGQDSVSDAWRPKLEDGGQDTWQPGSMEDSPSGVRYFLDRTKKNVPPPDMISNVTLAMGPKTVENGFFSNTRGYTHEPEEDVIKHGRRAGGNYADRTSADAAADAARMGHMNYAPTAHNMPGNVVTSLVTTGGDPLNHYTQPQEPKQVSQQ